MRSNTSPFEQIQELCLASFSANVIQEKELFQQESELIHDLVIKFHQRIQSIALGSVVLLWSQYLIHDRVLGDRNLALMLELLESGFLKLIQDKKPVTLSNFAQQKHDAMIDAIRSHQAWLIEKQEKMVSLYVEFATWLFKASYGLISMPIDIDKTVTAKRKLPFEKYIQLLTCLSPRERIFAKLYYLGGTRVLDDILNIKIQDIDFAKNQIHFADYSVYYSGHVLHDLNKYIESRRKGFVFINRYGERINHTVPYRSLKVAASKIGFPTSFTFKDLVQEA